MRTRFSILLALSFLSTMAFAAGQIPVFVQTVQVTGGPAGDDATTVHDLIEASVTEMRGYEVGDSSSKIILKPKLIKLGTASLVTLERLENGKVVFSERLKASHPEELDVVCKRLTRAVILEKADEEDGRVNEVTQSEANHGINRREVVGRWIIGLGPSGLVNLNQSGNVFGFTLGYGWELSEPSVMIKLFYDGNGGMGEFAIGADYFFSPKDTAVFGGVDLGYSGSTIQGNPPPSVTNTTLGSASGGATLGVAFFRLSRVNMEVALRYATQFASNSYGVPGTYGLRLSVLF